MATTTILYIIIGILLIVCVTQHINADIEKVATKCDHELQKLSYFKEFNELEIEINKKQFIILNKNHELAKLIHNSYKKETDVKIKSILFEILLKAFDVSNTSNESLKKIIETMDNSPTGKAITQLSNKVKSEQKINIKEEK